MFDEIFLAKYKFESDLKKNELRTVLMYFDFINEVSFDKKNMFATTYSTHKCYFLWYNIILFFKHSYN